MPPLLMLLLLLLLPLPLLGSDGATGGRPAEAGQELLE